MLENETAWQDRQRLALDCFRIDRDDGNAEKISDHAEKTLLVNLSRIEHLRCPGAAVHVFRELERFLKRRHTTREQKIDNCLAGRLIHRASLPHIRANAAHAGPE